MSGFRAASYVFWLALSLIGLWLLWQDVRELAPYPDVPGMPNQRVLIGWTLAGFGAVVVLIAWSQRFRRLEIPGRPPPEPFTAKDFLAEAPFVLVGLAGVGLLGALSPYYGVIAVLSLGITLSLPQSARLLGRGGLVAAQLFAGAQLLFIGVMFFIAYGEIHDEMGQTVRGGIGAALALLGPGLRLIVGSAAGMARRAG